MARCGVISTGRRFGNEPNGSSTLALAAALAVATLLFPAAGASRTTVGPSATLQSVSCTAADACFAVGSRNVSVAAGNHGLVERWNGTSWSSVPSPEPSEARLGSELYGVSCSSSRACMAVGQYEIPHGSHPHAESWNGTAWLPTRAPAPAGGVSGLNAVSCRSANRCVAVGYAIRAARNNAFSEVWNGKGWAVLEVALPAGTIGSSLDNVSCPSATVCIAVGDYQQGSGDRRPLAEKWNGRTWVRLPTPAIPPTGGPPVGPNGSHLTGVSCASALRCLAVGEYADASGAETAFTETWNGTAWRVIPGGPPPAIGWLGGVSCFSALACVGVGIAPGSGGTTKPLAEKWSNGQWATSATPAPQGSALAGLGGVSCRSATACAAVGSYVTSRAPGVPSVPFAEVWNGQTWTLTPVTP